MAAAEMHHSASVGEDQVDTLVTHNVDASPNTSLSNEVDATESPPSLVGREAETELGANVPEESVTPSVSQKRRKSSSKDTWTGWTHRFVTNRPDGVRICKTCSASFGVSTSTGTIKRHMETKHNVVDVNAGTANLTVQKSILQHSVSKPVEAKLDSAITTYIVTSTLLHSHCESKAFAAFAKETLPLGYKLKSARTVKRRILEMYVVLRCMVEEIFQYLTNRVTLTFDGWSNPQRKGFYSVTLHWFSMTKVQTVSCILDFFFVPPGKLVSRRVGIYLFKLVTSFSLQHKLLAVVSDNRKDAIAAAKCFANQPVEEGSSMRVLSESHCLRCVVHTFQLGVKAALQFIEGPAEVLRAVVSIIRNSKVKREMFRSICQSLYKKAREPPCLDTVTRWNSTYVFVKDCLSLKSAIITLMTSDGTLSDFDDYLISGEDWNSIKNLIAFLDFPARVTTHLCGQDSLAAATGMMSSKMLLDHAKKYLDSPVDMYKKMSTSMLSYQESYMEHIESDAAVIASYLDPRIPKPRKDNIESSVEYNRMFNLIRSTLSSYSLVDEHYIPDEDSNKVSAPLDIFGELIAGVRGEFGLEVDPENSEMTRFISLGTIPKETNIFQWWTVRQDEFKIHYRMACDYLGLVISSVPSERANSLAAACYGEDRHQLHDHTFKAEICTRSWLNLLEDLQVELPKDFRLAFKNLNSKALEDLATVNEVVEYCLSDGNSTSISSIDED